MLPVCCRVLLTVCHLAEAELMQSKGLGAEIMVSCMVQSGLDPVLTHAVLQHALIIGQHISGTQAHCPV